MKFYIKSILLLSLLLGLAYCSFEFYQIAKIVTSWINFSTSSNKVYFFFFGQICSVFFLAILHSLKINIRICFKSAVVMIFLPLLYNLILHFYFTATYRLDPATSFLAVYDNHISSNQVIHTHILKSLTAFIAETLQLNQIIRHGDPGLPFYYLLPGFGVILAVFFLLIFLSGMALLHGLFIQKFKSKDGRLPIVQFLLFIIAAQGLTLRYIDGGLLAYEVPAAFSVMLALLLSTNSSGINLPQEIIKFFLALLVPFTLILILINYHLFSGWCLLACAAVAFYIALTYILQFLCDKKINLAGSTIFFVALLLLAYGFRNSRNFQFYQELQSSTLNTSAYLTLPVEDYPGLELVARENQFAIYKTKTGEYNNLFQIYKRYNIRTNLPLAGIPSLNCNDKSLIVNSGKIKLLNPESMPLQIDSALIRKISLRPCPAKNECDYQYIAAFNPCFIPSKAHNLVANYLSHMGLKYFLLIPESYWVQSDRDLSF